MSSFEVEPEVGVSVSATGKPDSGSELVQVHRGQTVVTVTSLRLAKNLKFRKYPDYRASDSVPVTVTVTVTP
eukprot:423662-Rhodomonas_salina.2